MRKSWWRPGKPRRLARYSTSSCAGGPDDAEALKLAARAAGASGAWERPISTRRNIITLIGQVEAAVRQLEIALKERTLNYYQSARLSARLKDYKDELADIKGGQSLSDTPSIGAQRGPV